MKREILSLYSLKSLLVFLIIILHSGVLFGESVVYDWFFPVTRIAVPTFFMISGYFFACESYNEYESHCRKAIKKLLKMGTWGLCIYLVYYFMTKGGRWVIDQMCDKEFIYNFVVRNNQPFGPHLWYVFGYIYLLVAIGIYFKALKGIRFPWGG